MHATPLNLLLADDDTDDCIFFQEALEGLLLKTKLTTVNDGVQLMNYLLYETSQLPDALYLDLNMPRKNGFDCLSEIKMNEKLKQLPVIIFSTSFDKEIADRLREQGANYYIRKPTEFDNLKKVISKSLDLLLGNNEPVSAEHFVIKIDSNSIIIENNIRHDFS